MTLFDPRKRMLLSFCVILSLLSIGTSTNALSLTFKQTVAELVVSNKKLAKFYESTGYAPLWIGTSNLHRNRRSAFFKAISSADTHGLPVLRYNPKELKKQVEEQSVAIQELQTELVSENDKYVEMCDKYDSKRS